MRILDVRIDNLSRKEILERVQIFLSEKKFHQIATVNPEFILEAETNRAFKQILDDSDLNVADGIGIRFAFWRFGEHLRCRMPGIDLMDRILRLAEKENLGVFLASSNDGLSNWEETRKVINGIYPDLNIHGDYIDPKDESYQIISSTCQVVFCNFGAPYQELFLKRQKNDKIRLAMGVGGSYDFMTGKVRRAPYLLRLFGFEWLWRLAQRPDKTRPRRWKRVWRAVVVFAYKILTSNGDQRTG